MAKATKETKKETKPKATKKVTKAIKSKNIESKEVSKKAKISPLKSTKKVDSNKIAVLNSKVSKNSKKLPSTKKPVKITNTKKAIKAIKNTTKVTKAKATSSSRTSKKSIKMDVLEYYDLPYRYNETIVKILAQTPNTLFVYWDISDVDRKKYIKKYGENFFNDTIPILIINNKTKKYTFEIEINDFANCWYFNIQDEKCDYSVELGRKVKVNHNINIENNYLYISSSNEIESPNGHILFEKEQSTIYFRNIKTNTEYSKDMANLQFIKYFKRAYKLYDLYKTIYKDEEIFDINNPTSTFK